MKSGAKRGIVGHFGAWPRRCKFSFYDRARNPGPKGPPPRRFGSDPVASSSPRRPLLPRRPASFLLVLRLRRLLRLLRLLRLRRRGRVEPDQGLRFLVGHPEDQVI